MWTRLMNVGRRRFWLGGVGTTLLLGACLMAAPTAAAGPLHPQPAAAVITFQPKGTPEYTDPYPTPSELWTISVMPDYENCSAGCWGRRSPANSNEAYDGWLYFTVTRGASTVATSTATVTNGGDTSINVRGLQIGDTVTVYAKPSVFKNVPGFEGDVPSSDPYHVAATATFQPGPVVTNAECGSFAHAHTEVSGSLGVGATNVAAAWNGFPGTDTGRLVSGSVSGQSFTATDPKVVIDFGGPVCTSTGPVAGIRYESDPDGVVQVSEYEPPDGSAELGFLVLGHGASLIAPRHGTSAPLRGSRLAMAMSAFCEPAQMSVCRVNVTARLPSARPAVVGRGTASVNPGGRFDRLMLTLTNVGVRKVRARLRSTARGFSLPLTIRITGTGRAPVALHTSVFVLR